METLITFKTAKLAKDRKFNVECFNYYQDSHRAGIKSINSPLTNSLIDELHEEDKYCIIFYTAPSQSTLSNWLLENHGIFVNVEIAYNEWGRYSATIYKKAKDGKTAIVAIDGMSIFDSPIDAWEDGLFEALNLI